MCESAIRTSDGLHTVIAVLDFELGLCIVMTPADEFWWNWWVQLVLPPEPFSLRSWLYSETVFEQLYSKPILEVSFPILMRQADNRYP